MIEVSRVWQTTQEHICNRSITEGSVLLAVTGTNHPPEPFIYLLGEPTLCPHGNRMGTCHGTVYNDYHKTDFPCPGRAGS
jgi:hypothetical protein